MEFTVGGDIERNAKLVLALTVQGLHNQMMGTVGGDPALT